MPQIWSASRRLSGIGSVQHRHKIWVCVGGHWNVDVTVGVTDASLADANAAVIKQVQDDKCCFIASQGIFRNYNNNYSTGHRKEPLTNS